MNMSLPSRTELNERIIAAIVGPARTIGSFVNFGADYIEPGVVHFGGRGAVVVGEIDDGLTPRIDKLHRQFLNFDHNAILTRNIWGYLWSKLVYGSLSLRPRPLPMTASPTCWPCSIIGRC